MLVLAKSITKNRKSWGKLFPLLKECIRPPEGELNRVRLVHRDKLKVRYVDRVLFDSRFSLKEFILEFNSNSS